MIRACSPESEWIGRSIVRFWPSAVPAKVPNLSRLWRFLSQGAGRATSWGANVAAQLRQALAAMDSSYFTWLLLIACGVVLSLFAKPKSLLVVGAALTICSIVGLVFSSWFGRDNLVTLFGVLTMVTPVVFVMLAIGSVIANTLKTWHISGRSNSD